MQGLSSVNKTMFTYLDLESGTTTYYYEVPFKIGYGNYEVMGSSIVYTLYTSEDNRTYKFYLVRPKEGSYQEIFTSNAYEIRSFHIDSEGYIIASGSRFSDGAKVMLKITPGNNTPEVLSSTTSEIKYLVRVY
jgi:hypothetical protein